MIRLLMAWGILWVCLGCDADPGKEPSLAESGKASTEGADAYAAAQRLVGMSLVPAGPTTITFGQPGKDAGTGYKRQEDGTWKAWGWVEVPEAGGETERKTWQAVMRYLGEGRKWRGLWLRIGDQESGVTAAWKGEVPETGRAAGR